MSGKYGVTTKLGISSSNPVDARFNFLSDTVGLNEEHVQTAGNFGTRSEPSERVRTGLRRVGGTIVLNPNLYELNLLLEWIMGGTPTVGTPAGKTTFPLSDTLPTRYITSDRGQKVFTYDTCAVARARFYSTQGGPLSLTLDVVGKDESIGNSGTFPALSINVATLPFMHQDLVLTINSVAHKCPEVELIIDNQIDTDRFFNSSTLTSVQPIGRSVMLNTMLPYGDSSAAYNLASAGVTADATWTNGNYSLQAVIAALQIPADTPRVESRNEVFLKINAPCRKVGVTAGTTDELSLILDLT